MLEFKNLETKDKDIFGKYLKPYKFKTCEYSFTNLIIWKNSLDIKYAVYKDALIIKKKDFDGRYHFMQPIGYREEDFIDIINLLIKEKDDSFNYLFRCAEEDFTLKLKEIDSNLIIEEDRDNFDYIYNSSDLIKLSGKKLHGKKNHYNKFIKTYEYTLSPIDKETIPLCIDAARAWCRLKNCKGYLREELQGIEYILENKNDVPFDGMAVFVGKKLSAFTIGEKVNSDMAIIHIEKANPETDGLYSFINKTFVEKYYSDVPYINREQDLGLEGLRSAKLSYKPIKLEKKYAIK
jgi:uncharacterized protein